MGVLVSYDVSEKNKEMKKELITTGYFDAWTEGPKDKRTTVYLPNTTLWSPDKTVQQGLLDMTSAAKKLGVTLERAVAVPNTPSAAIPGEKHS